MAELQMAFQNLCNFETFQQFWSHYGYEGKLEDTIEQEFSRIKGMKFFFFSFFFFNTRIYFNRYELHLCLSGNAFLFLRLF